MASVADQELGSKLAFEIADLLRQRGSGDVKPLSSPTEMQFLGYCNEVGQLSELHKADGTAVTV